MSTKYNNPHTMGKSGKKARNYGGNAGMKRHAVSGTPHNHAISIARVREENKRLDEERKLREKRKGELKSSVKDLFPDFN